MTKKCNFTSFKAPANQLSEGEEGGEEEEGNEESEEDEEEEKQWKEATFRENKINQSNPSELPRLGFC